MILPSDETELSTKGQPDEENSLSTKESFTGTIGVTIGDLDKYKKDSLINIWKDANAYYSSGEEWTDEDAEFFDELAVRINTATEEGMGSISGPAVGMIANNHDDKKDETLVMPVESKEQILLNETYIQDQYGVFYRPVYVGENYKDHETDLVFEGKLYTTEGVGNCPFCKGAGKITVEKLGLKDCPDCEGSGDIQGEQEMPPQEMPPPQMEVPVEEEVEEEMPQDDDKLRKGIMPRKDPFVQESYLATEEGNWITMNGNHIMVKDGQTKKQAIGDFLDNVDDDLKSNKKDESPKEDKPKRDKIDKTDYSDKKDVYFKNDDGTVEKKSMSLDEYEKIKDDYKSSGWSEAGSRPSDLQKEYEQQSVREDTKADDGKTEPKEGDWDHLPTKDIPEFIKKFSYRFVRSKDNVDGLTTREIQVNNTLAEKLEDMDDKLWEENNFESGWDTNTRDGMSKFKKSLEKELGGRYDSINDTVQEILTDGNHHSMNQAINELKAGVKDNEIEDWWDKASLKSKQSLMGERSLKNKELQVKFDNAPVGGIPSQPYIRMMYTQRKAGKESLSTESCGCKTKGLEASISKYEKFVETEINVLKKRANEGESVGLMYGLPTVRKNGKKIKGTLAYAGVSLNDRIYLPEELAKGHGKTLPLLLNHSSTAGAEEEMDRLDSEMRDHLENEKDYEVGEVTLTWDADKLTLFYEGVIENEFFQKEVDEMDMAVSLGIFYDSNSPQVCDENCYTLIKGAEFREVSLVYHAGFPIATIEAVESKLKRASLKDIKANEDSLIKVEDKNDDDTKVTVLDEWKSKGEAIAEEEEDEMPHGGSIDVKPKETDIIEQPMMKEVRSPSDFSVRGVSGMTISNSNGVEKYSFDPTQSYSTNMIHFSVTEQGGVISGEEIQMQPKMATPDELTKEIESKPNVVFTDSDENILKKN